MSNFLQDEAPGVTRMTAAETKPLPLAPQVALEHLKHCQSLAVDAARAQFPQYLKALSHQFDVLIDAARSNQEVTELSGIQRLFHKNRAELEEYFVGYVAEGFVKFKQKNLCTELNGGADGELSLVDDVALEQTLVMAQLVQSLENDLAEPLWALNQRMALLNGGEPVREATNPLAPVQFCESLRKATQLVPMTSAAAKTVFSSFGESLKSLAIDLVADANHYLAHKGLLPDLQYRKVKPQVQKRQLIAEADALSGSSAESGEYQSSLLDAIRSLQRTLVDLTQGASFMNAQAAAGGSMLMPFSHPQLIDALQRIQVQSLGMMGLPLANGQVTSPMNIATLQQLINQQLGQQGHIKQNDMHAIDLVGRVFEFMLRDKNLPDSVKAALSYLHTPFLKLAFIDPYFFENPDHPARVLLNNLAEAGVRWIGNDGTVQHDMLVKIRETVDRLLNEFTDDVKVITAILLDFNSYAKNIVRRQELMEKRAAEKAQGEEKLREVKLRVNQEVMQRIEAVDLPSSVLLFLLQPWFDYLSFCVLRYGDESSQWQNALGVVDDLLHGLKPQTNAQLKSQQLALAARLKLDMQSGFDVIGYDPDKGNKLIESISDILTSIAEDKTPAPSPAPLVAEAEQAIANKQREPALRAEKLTEEEARMVDALKHIEFGTWFEFAGGKRLKVAWYNARTLHYMLVNQVGKKEAMLTGAELAKKMIAKTAWIVSGSAKPFFERALEDIYQSLSINRPADVQHI